MAKYRNALGASGKEISEQASAKNAEKIGRAAGSLIVIIQRISELSKEDISKRLIEIKNDLNSPY